MKKISHAIVLVEDIQSSLPRSKFSEADLDEAAKLLLKIEGVITPPILLQSGLDSYKVIEGHFEYYAALRAEEIDPLKGETINAYLVEDEKDLAVYKKQIEVFRQGKALPPTDNNSSDMSSIEARLAAIEDMLHKIISEQQIKTLQPISPPVQTPTIIASNQAEDKLLKEINTLDLVKLNYKLEQIKASKKVRENILKARQNPSFQPFQSHHELIKRIAGLGEKSFNTLLDNYNKENL
jgi:hypothetical protein